MYLEKIELKNFKNYESEIINFSDKINFITGENGSELQKHMIPIHL